MQPERPGIEAGSCRVKLFDDNCFGGTLIGGLLGGLLAFGRYLLGDDLCNIRPHFKYLRTGKRKAWPSNEELQGGAGKQQDEKYKD